MLGTVIFCGTLLGALLLIIGVGVMVSGVKHIDLDYDDYDIRYRQKRDTAVIGVVTAANVAAMTNKGDLNG